MNEHIVYSLGRFGMLGMTQEHTPHIRLRPHQRNRYCMYNCGYSRAQRVNMNSKDTRNKCHSQLPMRTLIRGIFHTVCWLHRDTETPVSDHRYIADRLYIFLVRCCTFQEDTLHIRDLKQTYTLQFRRYPQHKLCMLRTKFRKTCMFHSYMRSTHDRRLMYTAQF